MTLPLLLASSKMSGLPVEALTAPVEKPPAPPHDGPLLGRDDVVAEVVARLEGPRRLVTLVGSPGVGKTSVAARAVEALHESSTFRHGVRWVSFAEITDRHRVASTIMEAVGLHEVPSRVPRDRVCEFFAGQHGLLVLDNWEHVAKETPLIARLLAAAPELRILVTSREVLAIPGEDVLRIDPLAPEDAVRLFAARAKPQNQPFVLTTANTPVVERICALVDRIPLGIKLTAASAETFTPQDIVTMLEEALDLPAMSDPGGPSHHRTLGETIRWSYRRLPTDTQELLARLSVFSGGWSAEAATEVCGGPSATVRTMREQLAQLSRASLVESAEGFDKTTRFTLLTVIRSFALGERRLLDDVDSLPSKHCTYFAALARQAGPALVGDGQAYWLRVLDDERRNLDAAADWARAHDPPTAVEITSHLWRYAWLRGRLTSGRQAIYAALEASDPGAEPPTARARALVGAGVLARMAAHLDEAWGLFEAARDLAFEADDADLVGLATLNLGIVEENRRNFESAVEYFAAAEKSYADCGGTRGLSHVANCAGMIKLHEDDLDAAEKLFHESLASLPPGDYYSRSLVAGNIGWIQWKRRNFTAARVHYQQSMDWAESIGDEIGVANRLSDLSLLVLEQGDTEAAYLMALKALERFQDCGHRHGAAECLEGLGTIQARRERPSLAVPFLGLADAIRFEIKSPLSPPEAAVNARVTAALARDVGPDFYEDLWSAGRAMTMENAVAMARSVAPGGSDDPAASLPPGHRTELLTFP